MLQHEMCVRDLFRPISFHCTTDKACVFRLTSVDEQYQHFIIFSSLSSRHALTSCSKNNRQTDRQSRGIDDDMCTTKVRAEEPDPKEVQENTRSTDSKQIRACQMPPRVRSFKATRSDYSRKKSWSTVIKPSQAWSSVIKQRATYPGAKEQYRSCKDVQSHSTAQLYVVRVSEYPTRTY